MNKLRIGPPYISDTFRGMIMYPTVDLVNSKVQIVEYKRRD